MFFKEGEFRPPTSRARGLPREARAKDKKQAAARGAEGGGGSAAGGSDSESEDDDGGGRRHTAVRFEKAQKPRKFVRPR